jgi:hypothetical protein
MPVYHAYLSYASSAESGVMLKLAKSVIEAIMAQHDGVIVVANMGGNYNNRTELQDGLRDLLPYLNSIARTPAKRNIVLWRETSARHYSTHNLGYYGEQYV